MRSISIEIPAVPGEQDIEIEVKVNGVKQYYNYRVELFPWEERLGENRADHIRNMVEDYDSAWELVHIGMPTEHFIPITFRKKAKSL